MHRINMSKMKSLLASTYTYMSMSSPLATSKEKGKIESLKAGKVEVKTRSVGMLSSL